MCARLPTDQFVLIFDFIDLIFDFGKVAMIINQDSQ